MHKIKILHLIESLGRGGAESVLVTNLKYLNKNKYENIVCHLYKDEDLKCEIEALGILVYGLNMGSIYEWRKALFGISRIIISHKIDIIHTHLFGADLFGRLIGRLLKVPAIISTVHSTAYEPSEPYPYSLKRKFFDAISARFFSDKIIAVSKFAKSSLIKRLELKEENISVIYNSVDNNSYKPRKDISKLKKEFKIKDELILINVGRLAFFKGHKYLLDALRIIKKRLNKIKLLIVGNGPLKKELEDICLKIGLAEEVLFLRKRADVRTLLSMSNIFVFPTLSEGFGLALAEAMVSGVPCVATDIGPIPEIIQHGKTGILVKPRNTQQLANGILKLIEDPKETANMARAAREFALKNFDSIKNVNKLQNIYEEVCFSQKRRFY